MIKMYGIIACNGSHIDTSKSLHGAKCYATRNDFNKVSKRVGYNASLVCEKINGKWSDF